MSRLIAYLFVGAIGLLYWLLSFRRMIYINAPLEVIDPDEKLRILKWHLLASIILGVLVINVLVKKIQPAAYDYLLDNNYLMPTIIGSMILLFIIIGEIIQFNLLRSNDQFFTTKTVSENPDLLEPERNLITTDVIERNEFWGIIEEAKVFLNSRNEFGEALSAVLMKKDPRWLTEFFHTLIEIKLELLDKRIFPVASFILRKYEGDYVDSFIEYVIAHGEDTFLELKSDIQNIDAVDLDIMFVNKMNISKVCGEVYLSKTRKLLVSQKEFEESELNYVVRTPKEIKVKYPRVYEKFK